MKLMPEAKWPYDAPNRIFSLRAVTEIAEIVYGRPLPTGDELSRVRLLRGSLDDAGYHKRMVAWLLLPAQNRESPPPSLDQSHGLELTEAEWRLAQTIEDERTAEAEMARQALDSSRKQLRELCAYGYIEAYPQFRDGSFASAMDASRWNTHKFEEWLTTGRISTTDALGMSGSSEYALLFNAEQFRQAIKPRGARETASPPSLPNDTPYLSPYMELMAAVVKEFKITGDNHSKVELVRDFIEVEWIKRGLPKSEKLISAMATMVRPPEAQSGGLTSKRRVISQKG